MTLINVNFSFFITYNIRDVLEDRSEKSGILKMFLRKLRMDQSRENAEWRLCRMSRSQQDLRFKSEPLCPPIYERRRAQKLLSIIDYWLNIPLRSRLSDSTGYGKDKSAVWNRICWIITSWKFNVDIMKIFWTHIQNLKVHVYFCVFCQKCVPVLFSLFWKKERFSRLLLKILLLLGMYYLWHSEKPHTWNFASSSTTNRQCIYLIISLNK